MRLTAFWSEFNHHNAKQTPFVYHFLALTEPKFHYHVHESPSSEPVRLHMFNYPVRIRFFPNPLSSRQT
jgi:hypothetical protein